jgi:hypothetical protein
MPLNGVLRRAPLVLGMGLLVGCAHVAKGPAAKPIDAQGRLSESPKTAMGLLINGREVTRLSSRYFGFLELTFRNETSQWIRISHINLGFGSPAKDQSVFVPWGTDIDSWFSATEQRNAVRAANADLALGLITAGGAVAAGASKGGSARAVGGLVAVGGLAALTARAAEASVAAAESPFSGSHLLAVPFAIPPGLFAKRWIVLNTPARPASGCIESLLLDYTNDRGARERVWLEFRHPDGRSEWQQQVCPKEMQPVRQ